MLQETNTGHFSHNFQIVLFANTTLCTSIFRNGIIIGRKPTDYKNIVLHALGLAETLWLPVQDKMETFINH